MSQIICKKCLFEKLDPLNILASVRERVALLPEEDKVAEQIYLERLQLCSECKELSLGQCNQCGCFVEYRAARADMHCPDVNRKW